MKAVTTVLLLVLSAAVGTAFACDKTGTGSPHQKTPTHTSAKAGAKHAAPAPEAKAVRS
jgi:hypothetical protein